MTHQFQAQAETAVLVAEGVPGASRIDECHSVLIRESFGYLVSKIVPGFWGLISVPIFLRLIGVDEYGRLSMLLPLLLALSGAGSGWLQQGILRFHPGVDESGNTPAKFEHAVFRGTTYSVLVLAVVMLPVLLVLHYSAGVWLIAELYCFVILPYLVWLSLLQAQLQPQAVIRNEAVRSCAGFAFPVLLVVVTGRTSFSLVLLGLVFGYALPLLLNHKRLSAIVPMKRTAGLITPFEVRDPILPQLWRFGWAVGFWLMLCQVFPVVGRSAIQKYSGYAEAGIYASLYEIAVRCFSLFASPVMQAAHPRIMRYWNGGEYAAARKTIRRAVQIQVLLFVPVEAIGILFSGRITRMILGHSTAVSSSLLPLLMLGGFLWQIALFAHKPLEIMQRTKVMLGGMVIVLLVEAVGNYLFVPRWGLSAAVCVFVLGACAYIAFVLGVSGISFSETEGFAAKMHA